MALVNKASFAITCSEHSLRRLRTKAVLLPVLAASSSTLTPYCSCSALKPSASSSGCTSARCRFSMTWTSRTSRSVIDRTIVGISARPAAWAARNRRAVIDPRPEGPGARYEGERLPLAGGGGASRHGFHQSRRAVVSSFYEQWELQPQV